MSNSTNNTTRPSQTPAKKIITVKKDGRYHRDMTTVNSVVAVLTVLANLLVIYTVMNTTRFSSLSKSTFLIVNILCLVLLLALNYFVILGIRTRKKTLYNISMVLMCVFLAIGAYGTYAIVRVNTNVNKITSTSSKKENVSTSLVVYSESGTQSITDVTQLDGKVVGLATGTSTADLGKKQFTSKNVNVTYKEYQDYSSELLGLFNGEIACAILPSTYDSMFANETGLSDYLKNTASILTFEDSVTVSASTTGSDKDLTKDPFTVLLIGNADGLSDTIMIVSVNPISMKVTMSSIARDSYVPITCYNNNSNKINSAHAVSRDCLIATVEQLTGVSIDYYVDTNFQGVVDVVNALGGIVVDSPVEFVGQTASSTRGTKTVWVPAGDNVVLNGEQALAFARERYIFASGDFARQIHQQEVIQAMVRAIMRTRDINTFLKVLDAAGDNVQTNFTVEQLSGFVSYCMQKANRYYDTEHVENIFNIVSSRITGYSSGIWDEGLQLSLYIYRLYQGSISDTKAAVDRNIDMTTAISAPTTVKWSVNWDFTPPSISADSYNETIVQSEVPTTIGNYVGRSLGTLQSWANTFNIAVYATDEAGNAVSDGTITYQSVPSGTAIESISSISVTVTGATTASTPTPTTESTPTATSCLYSYNGTCYSTKAEADAAATAANTPTPATPTPATPTPATPTPATPTPAPTPTACLFKYNDTCYGSQEEADAAAAAAAAAAQKACTDGGGSWDGSSCITKTPEQTCTESGGTWDSANSTCVKS